jgi:hypothetical protein
MKVIPIAIQLGQEQQWPLFRRIPRTGKILGISINQEFTSERKSQHVDLISPPAGMDAIVSMVDLKVQSNMLFVAFLSPVDDVNPYPGEKSGRSLMILPLHHHHEALSTEGIDALEDYYHQHGHVKMVGMVECLPGVNLFLPGIYITQTFLVFDVLDMVTVPDITSLAEDDAAVI